jgi:hypothetical protein
MADERDKYLPRSDGEDEDVEGHKLAPDDDKHDKYAESSDDEDDEVEAHKF